MQSRLRFALVTHRFISEARLLSMRRDASLEDATQALEELVKIGDVHRFILTEGCNSVAIYGLTEQGLKNTELLHGMTRDERRGRAPAPFDEVGSWSTPLRHAVRLEAVIKQCADESLRLIPSRAELQRRTTIRKHVKRSSYWTTSGEAECGGAVGLVTFRSGATPDPKVSAHIRALAGDLDLFARQSDCALQIVTIIDREAREIAALQQRLSDEPTGEVGVRVIGIPSDDRLLEAL